jgi:acyl-CoA thioester hydrolase
MAYEFISTRKVEFSETDMAGLVHFSNYFRYMETAERDFFESLNLPLITTSPDPLQGWPRVRAECKFMAPLRFGDTIKIHLVVKAVKLRSIDYQFRIYREQAKKAAIQAGKGHLTTIFTQLAADGSLISQELSASIRAAITEAPASVLAQKSLS